MQHIQKLSNSVFPNLAFRCPETKPFILKSLRPALTYKDVFFTKKPKNYVVPSLMRKVGKSSVFVGPSQRIFDNLILMKTAGLTAIDTDLFSTKDDDCDYCVRDSTKFRNCPSKETTNLCKRKKKKKEEVVEKKKDEKPKKNDCEM